MPGGEAADIQRRSGEARGLRDLPLGEEPPGDATLVEDLDGARVEAARARAGQFRRRAPLDDRDVHPGELQLPGQHHPGGPATDDHHRVLGHVASPLAIGHNGERFCGTMRGLRQAPPCALP